MAMQDEAMKSIENHKIRILEDLDQLKYHKSFILDHEANKIMRSVENIEITEGSEEEKIVIDLINDENSGYYDGKTLW